MMTCSRCGYRGKDIGAMGKHYRKVHPKVMAKRKEEKSQTRKRTTLRMPKPDWTLIGKANGWLK